MIGFGLLVVYLGVIARRSDLPRNGRLGLRTPATLASDEAWAAGHRAAGPWLVAAGLGPAIAGVLALFRPSNDLFTLVSMFALALLVGLIGVATLVANTASHRLEVKSR